MAEHTKGELVHCGCGIAIKDGCYIADLSIGIKGGLSADEVEANVSRFILCWKSHDDLLAACKLASKRRHDGTCPQSAYIKEGPDSDRPRCNCWLSVVEAAIAKSKAVKEKPSD